MSLEILFPKKEVYHDLLKKTHDRRPSTAGNGRPYLVQLHTKRYPLLCGGLRWLAQSHDFCDGLGSPVERASVLIPLFNKEIDLFPKVLD